MHIKRDTKENERRKNLNSILPPNILLHANLLTQTDTGTDRRTDRQTDRQTDSGTDKKGIWTTQATKQKKPNSFDSLAGGQREKSELKKKKYYYSYNI